MAGLRKLRIRQTILIYSSILTVTFIPTIGKTIYVDNNANGANDGSNWIDSYTYLQDALGDANFAEKPVEVLVAQGLYKPDQGENQITGNRETSFQLFNGVILQGGFAGSSEADPEVRDIEAYATILSGDLNGDDIEVGDPYELLVEPTRADNSYHVLTSNNTDNTAILDGFTIMFGNANGHKFNNSTVDKYTLMRGGGIYNVSSNPIVSNCTFLSNSASYGGGMGNLKSRPNLINCSFVWNTAARYGGGMDNYESDPDLGDCTFSDNSSSWGGGMSNRVRSNSSSTNCTFSNNRASWYGGSMINMDSAPNLTGCTITSSEARLGGGMRNSDSSPTLTNCLIVDNFAYCPSGQSRLGPLGGHGGSMYNSNSTPVLTNCAISGNCASNGAGGIYSHECVVTLTNCILWNNSTPQLSGGAIVSFSNIKGGWPGNGNLDVDPLFVRPGYLDSNGTPAILYDDLWVEGDYHLKSCNGRWDPKGENWAIDTVTSPCIDTGEPTNSIGFEPFPNGGIINMGAYGGTIEASMSSP